MDRSPLLPLEEEGRLNDMPLRENFIERVFAAQFCRSQTARLHGPRCPPTGLAVLQGLPVLFRVQHLRSTGAVPVMGFLTHHLSSEDNAYLR
jgi:hypothetical protein